MIVKRYFHIRPQEDNLKKRKFNGATALVIGDTDIPGQVDLQVAFCSKRDLYCRRIGRQEVNKAKVKIIALRYLSGELADIEDTVNGYQLENQNDFLFALRYFLPKE